MSMMYNYLRGDLRKGVLTYLFHEKRYSKGDTELVDTWLDGVRNLRNYCAHNSMVVGLKSSIVLRHQKVQKICYLRTMIYIPDYTH